MGCFSARSATDLKQKKRIVDRKSGIWVILVIILRIAADGDFEQTMTELVLTKREGVP